MTTPNVQQALSDLLEARDWIPGYSGRAKFDAAFTTIRQACEENQALLRKIQRLERNIEDDARVVHLRTNLEHREAHCREHCQMIDELEQERDTLKADRDAVIQERDEARHKFNMLQHDFTEAQRIHNQERNQDAEKYERLKARLDAFENERAAKKDSERSCADDAR